MPTLNLKDVTIKKLQDKNMSDYYLIVDNKNQDEAYFCFSWTIKSGWDSLVNNWEQIKEVEIEYVENKQGFNTYKKVINLYAAEEGETLV